MTYLQVIGALVVGVASFFAGWVAATEKMRMEIFRVRLETYRDICKAFTTVLMAEPDSEPNSSESPEDKVKFHKQRIEFSVAKVELIRAVLTAGPLVSPRVMAAIVLYTKRGSTGEDLWHTYVRILNEMATDLGLKHSASINEGLLAPTEALMKLLRKDSAYGK